MASPLVGNTLVYGILFGLNEAILSHPVFDPTNLYHHGISGFISGAAQSFIGAPMELTKIRLQVSFRQ